MGGKRAEIISLHLEAVSSNQIPYFPKEKTLAQSEIKTPYFFNGQLAC